MSGHVDKEYGFDRLFEAVVYFPEKVHAIVKEDPDIVFCENYAGETVLQFFSMEGRDDIVGLLLDMGARADEWAVYFACGPAHVSTVAILLAAGAEPDCEACSRELTAWGVPRKSESK
ncbi:ankyrin repeat domain-containing protein [Zooshikella ganghwensis]|uniref:Ankyrin repeat domain-containing protein n=1 Tax=Zooshikella ganghwensis TaxID=202772 RepID=A0A4P9VI13_9GAMM|nr:ankyrin repeat domain-containing protein [Zooshikella ganghwensis]RDH41262.1 ankyrin repeat domain-containing protein [Zooshikella ganghwensis]